MKLVECVPNFSEGKDLNIINAITDEIKGVNGVVLLDVDPGRDTNRTVVTFVGSPQGVEEAAFKAIKKAGELIDMTKHKGEHPRMGATDVCPFIPVSEVTVEDCVEIAKKLGKRVGEELGIPVYLYEYAATRPHRKSLSDIRKGEYEALPEKMKDPDFIPDFGPPIFNPKSGATVIGCREFLIAYNINLNTTSAKLAKDIALEIRESGRFLKDKEGKFLKDQQGNKIKKQGLFQECKATGWFIEEYQQAQVTMNLTNYKITPIHQVFDAVCKLAHERGLRVTGSELVGLIPLDAVLMAGRHYINKQGKCMGIPEADLIRTAVQSLGLEDISPFDPAKKIIEYSIEKNHLLKNMSLEKFCDQLSTDSPAPGGGSVAALCGSLSASLSAMVANLTYDKKGYKDKNSIMDELSQKSQILKKKFMEAIDKDTDAFNQVMSAMKLKPKTPEEEEIKKTALESATKKATLIPFSVLRLSEEAVELADAMAKDGNKNSLSDAGVSALCALTCAQGAYMNILINLPGVQDQEFKNKYYEESERLLQKIQEKANKVQEYVLHYLKEKK